jgi:spermidine synthase
MNRFKIIVFLLFFFSGISGLIYEVVWTRSIGLLFGHTVQAASIVLASYFGGMAFGYAVAGKFTGKIKNPLLWYGVAEIFVALWALLIPLMIAGASAPSLAHLLNHDAPGLQTFIRSVFSLLILFPATAALGATLPLMAKVLADDADAKWIQWAYALNIAGGVLGVFVATFFLMGAVGISSTGLVAIGLSLGVGVLAILVSRGYGHQEVVPETHGEQGLKIGAESWMAALSGFGVLALQVLYMRLFSLVLHNSVYTFAVVVIVFLAGLSISSVIASRLKPNLNPSDYILTICQIGALAVASSVLLFGIITGVEYFEYGDDFPSYLVGVFGFATLIMIIPVSITGMILPVIWGLAVRPGEAGRVVGRLTSINTLGAALGALATSFVLLPWFGLWKSFAALGLVYLVGGTWYAYGKSKKRPAFSTLAAGIFCLVTVVVLAPFNGIDEGQVLVDRKESAYGWIDTVRYEKSGSLQLRQNVHYGLGSTSSVTMERRQTHIPLLLHKDPRDVLFLGLATGITAGAALDHPEVEHTTVVELIPDVVEGAKQFSDFSRNIVGSDRSTIVINDARHFLYATEKNFDVIVADLFVPWESQTGYLYTKEHYETSIKKLKPGGLFCQWIALWQLGPKELEIIANTFSSVFPYTSLWFAKLDDRWTTLGFVGSESPISIDRKTLVERLSKQPSPKLHRDRSWLDTPKKFFRNYAGDWPRSKGEVLNQDDFPVIEFSTPQTAWTVGARLRYDRLSEYFESDLSKLPFGNVSINGSNDLSSEAIGAIRAFQKARLKHQ